MTYREGFGPPCMLLLVELQELGQRHGVGMLVFGLVLVGHRILLDQDQEDLSGLTIAGSGVELVQLASEHQGLRLGLRSRLDPIEIHQLPEAAQIATVRGLAGLLR